MRWSSCPSAVGSLLSDDIHSLGLGSRREWMILIYGYCAVTPPSMTISLPVMKDASSEARNRTP